MSSPSWMYDCSEVNIPEGVIASGVCCFADVRVSHQSPLPERCSY